MKTLCLDNGQNLKTCNTEKTVQHFEKENKNPSTTELHFQCCNWTYLWVFQVLVWWLRKEICPVLSSFSSDTTSDMEWNDRWRPRRSPWAAAGSGAAQSSSGSRPKCTCVLPSPLFFSKIQKTKNALFFFFIKNLFSCCDGSPEC